MRKGKNGLYRKTFVYNGKRYDIRATTKEELEDKVREKKEMLEKNEQDLYNPTLNAYYELFTDVRRRQICGSTLNTQKKQFKVIAGVIMANKRPFGEMRINDIKRRDIEYARQYLLDAGKTPQYLNNIFAHLNHVFNSAVTDETIVKNPCKALKQLKRNTAPIGETKHRALSIDETIKFFEEAEKRNSYYKNIFKLMLVTGMRVGEVTALYKTDIDKRNGFVHVAKTISKNEDGAYQVSDTTKTESGKRDIPLTKDIINAIREQEKLNRIIFGFDWSGLLFKSVEGGIMREYQVNREIKRICKDAEIELFTCHAFRNTFATRFIEQRPQDYKILSEILGHKDVSITLNLYTHVMVDNKVKAMQDLMINVS